MSQVASFIYVMGGIYTYLKYTEPVEEEEVEKFENTEMKIVKEIPKTPEELIDISKQPGGSQELAKIAGQPGGTEKLNDLGLKAATLLPPPFE